jgi:peptide deformylase
MPDEITSKENELASEAPKVPGKYDVPFDDSGIVKYGEAGWDVLRQVAQEIKVVDSDVRSLVRDMGRMMYSARGVGLAAPQVGRSVRLFVYDAGDGLRAMINPQILRKRGDQVEPEEGCLSIPGLRGVVHRALEIEVKALNEDGRPVKFRTKGFEARVIQHELDHLDGVLFIDLADPKTLHMLTPEEQQAENEGASEQPPAE